MSCHRPVAAQDAETETERAEAVDLHYRDPLATAKKDR
jgi:hypothetical protein